MDPHTGKMYDLEKDDIPEDVRERLVPVDPASFFEQEVEQLKEMSEAYEAVKEANDKGVLSEEERFYPVNRAARRKADKRNRALLKRKPNG